MKKILLLVLLLVTIKTIAQSNNDVRKSKWGMSMNEVIESEIQSKPIVGTRNFLDASGTSINEDELIYDNVLLDNGLTSKLIYIFHNKKLSEVTIIVYGNSPSNRASKSKKISFLDKVKHTTFVIEALKEKGYTCDFGWSFPYSYPCTTPEINGQSKSCSLDETTLNAVYKLAKECAKSAPILSLESKRTGLYLVYNEWDIKNYQMQESESYDNYYNTICWMHYKPNSLVTNQLKKDTF